MTHAEGPAVSPPARGRTIGAVLGALPQALLLTLMLLGVATADNLAERRSYGLLVFPEVTIVPISVLIGLVCLSQPASRPFGRGALAGTLISAALFIPICLVVTDSG